MKKYLCLLLCLLLCLSALSCSKKKDTAEDILGGIMSELKDLPKGKIYLAGAEQGDEENLSEETAESLYGESAVQYLSLTRDYAIYLSSFAEPCEISIFICYSSSDALKIERMCRERADALLVALRESELCDTLLDATVIRKGRTVAFAMTEKPSQTQRIIKKFI